MKKGRENKKTSATSKTVEKTVEMCYVTNEIIKHISQHHNFIFHFHF